MSSTTICGRSASPPLLDERRPRRRAPRACATKVVRRRSARRAARRTGRRRRACACRCETPVNARVVADESAAAALRARSRQAHHAARLPPSAARDGCASLKGSRTPAIPGSPRDPCRRSARRRPARASRDRRAIAARAIGSIALRDARSRCPRRSRAMIARGVLAARVVVGDDDAIGELRGDRAHQRALARVAIAAAAEHADQPRPRACARPRAPASTFSSASGVCA